MQQRHFADDRRVASLDRRADGLFKSTYPRMLRDRNLLHVVALVVNATFGHMISMAINLTFFIGSQYLVLDQQSC